jgi:hypothetical protein
MPGTTKQGGGPAMSVEEVKKLLDLLDPYRNKPFRRLLRSLRWHTSGLKHRLNTLRWALRLVV